jgi:hypothetical protein
VFPHALFFFRCRRGPPEIRPIGGIAWARRNAPPRMRATYHRLKGGEPFFGFFDLRADCLDGLFRKQERLPELFDSRQASGRGVKVPLAMREGSVKSRLDRARAKRSESAL